MLRPAVAAIVISALALLPGVVYAQTPELPPETPVGTPAPTPTVEAPVPTAGPDEIIFIGAVEAPPGSTITADFYNTTFDLSDHVICATASTTPSEEPALSRFLLRVPVSCAEGLAVGKFCWSGGHCYVDLADPPQCDFSGCTWSDTVRPGATVDFGLLPSAGADEIIFVGEVPVAEGAIVTVAFVNIATLQLVTCATITTTATADPGRSAFVLVVDAKCGEGLDFPRFCWSGDLWSYDLCHVYFDPDPRVYLDPTFTYIQPGMALNLGLLRVPEDPGPPPRPPSTGDGAFDLPRVGASQPATGPWAEPLFWAALGLTVAGLSAGATGLALRRQREKL